MRGRSILMFLAVALIGRCQRIQTEGEFNGLWWRDLRKASFLSGVVEVGLLWPSGSKGRRISVKEVVRSFLRVKQAH
jgi:hypothetical protein